MGNSRKTLVFGLLLWSTVLVTCGRVDERDRFENEFGEPDSVSTLGADPFWRETWFYFSATRAYEFRRTSGCGSPGDIYLYRSYPFFTNLSDTTKDSSQVTKPLQLDERQESFYIF